jgi:alkaline phosphatase D
MPEQDRWYYLFGRRLNRRDFIRIGRDLGTCVALGSLPAYGSPARARANPFTSGVASGDPLPNGVVLWTRLDPTTLERDRAGSVRWEIAEDDRFRRIAKRGAAPAPAELGHSVHVEVEGLKPARDYWYRFMAGSEVSPVGRTRTTSARTSRLDRLRFAFVSCQNYEHGLYTAYQHLASEDLDLVFHLGDYIYERHYASPVQVRKHEAGEVFTLDQYRARYALYRSDPNLQAAHAACAWVVTTDDHEVSNNYAGDVPEIVVPPDQFLLRRAAAYQAYYEFMPLRRSSLPRGPSIQLFRRLDFGSLAAVHVLDTRQYRADQACGDGRKSRCPEAFLPGRTMMGPPQERWLDDGLRSSKATWNVLANQVMIAQTKQMAENGDPTFSMDRWDGYVVARDRLVALLAAVPRANPVVITGDIHSNYAADLLTDFENSSARAVGSEFVGTSISSGGDGADVTTARMQALNPHIRFYNARRGYVRVLLTPALWTTDYRTMPYVTRRNAPIETVQSLVVEAGQPGVKPA